MKNLFNLSTHVPTYLDTLIDSLQGHLNSTTVINSANTKSALAFESVSEDSRQRLQSNASELMVSVESVLETTGMKKGVLKSQEIAATYAGMLAGDLGSFLSRKLDFPLVSTESMGVVQSLANSNAVSQRVVGLEAYDERNNKDSALYSIAYNLQAARQDEFGETFFSTIVLAPDKVGYGITVDLMMVYNGITHAVSGDFKDFEKKNIIRAITDPTILHHEVTTVYPIHRPQSVDKFVDAALVAPKNIIVEGRAIKTAPLAIGKTLNLIGLSQDDTLLAAGVATMEDSLDPAITLTNVYVKFVSGADVDVIKIPTVNLPLSNFTYSVQNNYRVMNLAFSTTSVLLNLNTKTEANAALTAIDGIVTNDYIVRLKLRLSGDVNIETGETTIFGNSVEVYSISNNAGVTLDTSAGAPKAVADILAVGTIIGYDLKAFKTNSNRRQRGQFIDTTRYTQMYNVPLLSPITAIHPVNNDTTTDSSDVLALITTTNVRTSNAAVDTLLAAADQLKNFVDQRDLNGVSPDVLGVGRFFVRPTYLSKTIDIAEIVNNLTSTDRASDTQAAIVNVIKNLVYRAFRDSEYKAAYEVMNGGISKTPTVAIGTDPVISRYITISGDIRTLGNDFDLHVVSTNNIRMKNKIIATFVDMSETRNTQPNALNFGNMIWAPELVLTANNTRGGSMSRETIVQPRFLHVVNLPIIIDITVENIELAAERTVIPTSVAP